MTYGFTNPQEALQHYITNCNQYGLVISDIRMPVMNRFDLLKEIKEIDATSSFFLMSAYDTVDFSELEDKNRWIFTKTNTNKNVVINN